MGKIGEILVGFKTILGVVIQIAGAVGMLGAALMDYINGIEGSGLVKGALGLGFMGNAFSQVGIRFSKKAVVVSAAPATHGPNEGLIPASRIVGTIVDEGSVAKKS